MTGDTQRVRFHQLLGSGMQMSLATVNVLVTAEATVLSESPRVDVLLVQRETGTWTEAQRARLPDGVRDSAARHILVEFKNTESVTEDGILQAAAYDLFYRQAQELPKDHVLPVVLSAKTPQQSRLAMWGYKEVQKGVFRSGMPIVRRVMLLALNRLPARPNNAYVKIFASRKQQREAAFASLDKAVLAESSESARLCARSARDVQRERRVGHGGSADPGNGVGVWQKDTSTHLRNGNARGKAGRTQPG
jgi:hypothetical protein